MFRYFLFYFLIIHHGELEQHTINNDYLKYTLAVDLVLSECSYLDSLQVDYDGFNVEGFRLNPEYIAFDPPFNYPELLKEVFKSPNQLIISKEMYQSAKPGDKIPETLIYMMGSDSCSDRGVNLEVFISPIVKDLLMIYITGPSKYPTISNKGIGVGYHVLFDSTNIKQVYKSPIVFN